MNTQSSRLQSFRVRSLTEEDMDAIVDAAGGERLDAKAFGRDLRSADYAIADAVLELKMLDDEGFAKPERQTKLASLFSRYGTPRPVVVIDRERLPHEGRRTYDRIVEGPIKGAVRKARQQLKQSLSQRPEATTAILWIVNNGYTALGHGELCRLAAHRVRNDSSDIDGVVVSGCYFHSDGFDDYFLWPIDYVPVNADRRFRSFESLREQWNQHANRFMTDVVLGRFDRAALLKAPVLDAEFHVGGVTYVKPAPPLEMPSQFYGERRPRTNSSGIEGCPPVARTFPAIARVEWAKFSAALPGEELMSDYTEYAERLAHAAASNKPLQPFVPVDVTFEGWNEWQAGRQGTRSMQSVHAYANSLFETRVRAVLSAARDRSQSVDRPTQYVLVVTEEIGQDRANDLSAISIVDEQATGGSPEVTVLAKDLRAFHEHALAVGCAYAVAERIDVVLWETDLRYAWI